MSLKPSELSFYTVCQLLEYLKRTKQYKKKKGGLEVFIDQNILRESRDAYSVFRLLLPHMDEGRGNYKLLEQKLIDLILRTVSWAKDSPETKQLKGYKRPDKRSEAAGKLAETLEELVFRKCCFIGDDADPALKKTLKVGELNDMLDEMVKHQGKTEQQAQVMRRLLDKTTPTMMKWIVQIILKSLRIGLGENTVFRAWHYEAQEYYNNSGMSIRDVFNKMIDRGRSYGTAIQPGKAVRPQLAAARFSAKATFVSMHAKAESKVKGKGTRAMVHSGPLRPFVIEIKFDGERMQVHKLWPTGRPSEPKAEGDGDGAVPPRQYQYYSRNAIEHGARSSYSVLDKLFEAKVKLDRFILDGELIVFNKKRLKFEPFGGLKPVINAVRSNKHPDSMLELGDWEGGGFKGRGGGKGDDTGSKKGAEEDEEGALRLGDCEILYVAFDILFVQDQAVSKTMKLEERYGLLERFVVADGEAVRLDGASGVCARIVPMVPDKTQFSDVPACKRASSEQEIQEMVDKMEKLGEEGIVVKALDSYWIPDDRSNWSKMKPDYIKQLEIDAVVVGGWWGEHKRGGVIAEYLLALPVAGSTPLRFQTFCKVGTGFSDAERAGFHDRVFKDDRGDILAPPDQPPDNLEYTRDVKATPDVWLRDLAKAPVLQMQADLRLIRSRVFFTNNSVRFPRIAGERYDKLPRDATSVQQLEQEVAQKKMQQDAISIADTAPLADEEEGGKGKERRSGRRKAGASTKRTLNVLGKFAGPQVAKESSALEGCVFYFPALGESSREAERQEAAGMVKRLGGRALMRYAATVTHVVAAPQDARNIWVRQLVGKDLDVIDPAWLRRCAAARRKLAPLAREFLHISQATRESRSDLDAFGDPYFDDTTTAQDVRVLLEERMKGFAFQPDDAAGLDRDEDEDEEEGGGLGGLGGGRMEIGAPAAANTLQGLLHKFDLALGEFGGVDARFTLLRNCTIFMLDVAAPSSNGSGGVAALFPEEARLRGAAEGLAADIHSLGARQLRAEAQLHGAELAGGITQAVTHVVCLVEDEAPDLSPAALLEAVSAQGGGPAAVQALRRGLEGNQLQLVTAGWLEETFDALEQEQGTAQLVASESDHLLNLADADHLERWPWDRFQLPPSPAKPARPAASSRRRGTALRRRAGGAAAAAGAAPAVKAEPLLPEVKPDPGAKAEPGGAKRASVDEEGEAGPSRPAPKRTRPAPNRQRKQAQAQPAEVKEDPLSQPARQPAPAALAAARPAAPAPAAAAPVAPSQPALPAAPLAAPPAILAPAPLPTGLSLFDEIFGGGGAAAAPLPAAAAAPPAAPPAGPSTTAAAAAGGPSYMVPAAATSAPAVAGAAAGGGAEAGVAGVGAPPGAATQEGAAPAGASPPKGGLRARMQAMRARRGQ